MLSFVGKLLHSQPSIQLHHHLLCIFFSILILFSVSRFVVIVAQISRHLRWFLISLFGANFPATCFPSWISSEKWAIPRNTPVIEIMWIEPMGKWNWKQGNPCHTHSYCELTRLPRFVFESHWIWNTKPNHKPQRGYIFSRHRTKLGKSIKIQSFTLMNRRKTWRFQIYAWYRTAFILLFRFGLWLNHRC